jgi:hypothetical protein
VSATVQARFIDGGEMDNFFGSKAEKFWSKKNCETEIDKTSHSNSTIKYFNNMKNEGSFRFYTV